MSTPNTSKVKWVDSALMAKTKGKFCNIPVVELADLTDVVEGLRMALDHQVANRGTADAFYACHTYPHGQMPEWVERAEKALTQLEAHRKEG